MDTSNVFSNINCLEFAWVAVGPNVGRVLGGWGATVVKVESMQAPCPLRSMGPFKDMTPGLERSGFFSIFNPNKYGVSLNLQKPEARETARKLIAWADVVTESFTPGTMDDWGLGYEEAKRIKPDIIYFSTCMQGQTGPHSNFRGYGTHMSALGGFFHMTGWSDREPTGPYGAYTDFVAMMYSQAVVLAALDYRRRTGKGTYIDLSQIEAGLQFLGPMYLDYAANNREMKRNGNRYDPYCPHGAYPCREEESFVSIAVGNEEQWRGFCRALGDPEWSREPRFADMGKRKENQDKLDQLIGEWTKTQTAWEVTEKLQAVGVAAGPVLRSSEVITDPQLKHRKAFVTLEHSEIGPHYYRPSGYQMSLTPEKMERAAPCLGEHNDYVLREILNMNDEEIAELIMAEALE